MVGAWTIPEQARRFLVSVGTRDACGLAFTADTIKTLPLSWASIAELHHAQDDQCHAATDTDLSPAFKAAVRRNIDQPSRGMQLRGMRMKTAACMLEVLGFGAGVPKMCVKDWSR